MEHSKKVNVIVVLFLIAAMGASLFAGINFAKAEENEVYHGEFIGLSGNLSDQELYNATNTYNVVNGFDSLSRDDDYVVEDSGAVFYDWYNTGTKNTNVVDQGRPQITVLTHGFGGNAGHWSNNEDGTFAENENSIIDAFSGNNANLYLAKIDSNKKLYLIDIRLNKLQDGTYNKTITSNVEGENHIATTIQELSRNDISKHTVIIFEAQNPDDSNAAIYNQFNYALSKIVYNYKQLNGGKLPRINLIGHSRGGLTNMQYALDHPDLIDSIFSFGTPYLGSHTAKTDLGKEIGGGGKGMESILSSDVYYHYCDRWNNNYDTLYKNIKVYALGGYSDTDLILDALEKDSDVIKEFYSDPEMIIEIIRAYLNYGAAIIPRVANLLIAAGSVVTCNVSGVILSLLGMAVHALNPAVIATMPEPYLAIVSSEVDPENNLHIANYADMIHDIRYDDAWELLVGGAPTFRGDLLVDLDSQLGIDENKAYRGFVKQEFLFTDEDLRDENGTWKDAADPNNVLVVHNLEPFNDRMIKYVLNHIDVGQADSSDYDVRERVEGGVEIVAYKGAAGDTITIPEEYETDVTIGEIASRAFALDTYGKSPTTINVPDTVWEINDAAFENSPTLQNVNIGASSVLTSIGKKAFSNSGLRSFNVSANVNYIGAEAFYNCRNLEAINVDANNRYYTSVNGVLYSKDMTKLIAVPGNLKNNNVVVTEFTVPETVIMIYPKAFSGNKNLTRVNLSTVTYAENGLFEGCSNVTEIIAPNLQATSDSAFKDTAWYKNKVNNAESVVLGKTYIRHAGDASVVDLSGYYSVSDFAFAANTALTKVIAGRDLRGIGDNAFQGCTNLTTVDMLDAPVMIVGGNGMFDGLSDYKIIVIYPQRDDYVKDELWARYAANIVYHTTHINFDSLGGTSVDAIDVIAGTWPNLPSPTRLGYRFNGWFTAQENGVASGEEIKSSDIWLSREDSVELYAAWEIQTYNVTFYLEHDIIWEVTVLFTVNDQIELPVPTKYGYNFAGWYDNEACNGDSYAVIEQGTTGNKVLYAKWTPKTYTLTLKCCDDATHLRTTINATFGEDIVLTENYIPQWHDGYIFDGWGYNGKRYIDNAGNAVAKWDIDGNVTLEKQVVLAYYIKIDYNNQQILWVDKEGNISDKQSAGIEYGTTFVGMDEIIRKFYMFDDSAYRRTSKEGHIFQYFTWEYVNSGANVPSGSIVNSIKWEDFSEDDGRVLTIYPYYTKEGYVIKFRNYNDERLITFGIDYGTEVIYPTLNIPTGYLFDKWEVVVGGDSQDATKNEYGYMIGEAFNYTLMPDLSPDHECDGEILVLKLRIKPKELILSFNANNGTNYPNMKIAYDQTECNLTFTPTKLGYTFGGWADANGVLYFNASGVLLRTWDKAENTTLYAVWNAITYRVKLVTDGTITDSNYTKVSGGYELAYTIENGVIVLPSITRVNAKHLGWYVSPTDNSQRIYSVSAADTIHYTVLYEQVERLFAISFHYESYHETFYVDVNTALTAPRITRPYKTGYWQDEVGITVEFGETRQYSCDHDFNGVMWTIERTKLDRYNRSTTFTITDADRFGQSYDELWFSVGLDAKYAYQYLEISISFKAWEKDDGYQYVYLYDGPSSSAQLLGTYAFEHGAGKKDTNPATYSHTFKITTSAAYGKTLCLRYGADGAFADTWYNNTMKVVATLAVPF